MFSKIVVVSALLTLSAAGIIKDVQYSPANVVSSQSFIRHDDSHPNNLSPKLVAINSVEKVISPPYHQITKVITPITKVIAPITKVITPVTKVIETHPKLVVAHSEDQFIHPEPRYEFSYSVADDKTGDHKSQHEVANRGFILGEYTMLEADGRIRRVEYTADDQNGFNAVVSHSDGHHKHIPHPDPKPINLNPKP